MSIAPLCPYCGGTAVLVSGAEMYPHRPDLAAKMFWRCDPCDAYAGCHRKGANVDGKISDGTMPIGTLANRALRSARQHCHKFFDQLWQGGDMHRNTAYGWLAGRMNIRVERCHIGMFDEDQCADAIAFVREYLNART